MQVHRMSHCTFCYIQAVVANLNERQPVQVLLCLEELLCLRVWWLSQEDKLWVTSHPTAGRTAECLLSYCATSSIYVCILYDQKLCYLQPPKTIPSDVKSCSWARTAGILRCMFSIQMLLRCIFSRLIISPSSSHRLNFQETQSVDATRQGWLRLSVKKYVAPWSYVHGSMFSHTTILTFTARWKRRPVLPLSCDNKGSPMLEFV